MPLLKRQIAPLVIALWAVLAVPFAGWMIPDGHSLSGSTKHIGSALAQDRDEVFFSFRYRAVGDRVVIGMYSYDTGLIYLPTTELFELLGIFYQTDSQNLRVHGHYLDTGRPYEIHFNNNTARIDGQNFTFSTDDMLVDELDFYLVPEVFAEVFGLHFTVDMSGLIIRLETADVMPVVERLERRQRRERIEREIRAHQLHPLEFERSRRVLSGGFLDYSLTGNVIEQNSNITDNYSYTASIGAEFMGGDIQGNMFGSWSEMGSNFTTSGLRWRYVFENQNVVTQLRLGQHSTEGPQSRFFRGLHLTNQPIMPRRTLDEFVFRGMAPSESEVELFINNRLVDYQIVDDLGNFQFLVPINYGSSQVRIMVYEPDGRVRELDRRVQVPFTFLPPGEFNYHLSAGRMDTPVFGAASESDLLAADLTLGVTRWLTVRGGGEYLSEVHTDLPFLYGGLSMRVFGQYLTNIDFAPEAYYRFATSVVYPNSVSWDVGYTYFTTEDGLYNPARNDYEVRANLFFPLQLGPLPLTFRVGGDRQEFGGFSSNRVRGDLGVRMGRVSLRGGYRDNLRMDGSELLTNDGRVTATATYSTPRSPSVPRIIRSTYLRAQADYSMRLEEIERVDVQLSRSIFRSGRLRLSWGRNMIRGFNTIEGALTFDFNRTRSATTVRSVQSTNSVRHNIRGSIGYDDFHRRIVLDNRQQVGRSAASVRLFVDRNNSGRFDEGDELIHARAVRLGRSGQTRLHRDGVVRVTQIQSYYHDNMEIAIGSIPNPLLVPVIREFSFVADPNRFKPMDIPFYMSGVIDGMVLRQRGETQQGLGGVRVMLRQINGDYEETLRTFSDGSYYAMEIPPGRYEAWVDTTQQDFLNARSISAVRRFEVRALAEGDFLEDLNFVLQDRTPIEEPEEEEDYYRILAQRSDDAIRLYVSAQEAFYRRNFGQSLELVEQSLALYETDFGLALLGSVLFVHGLRDHAERLWETAANRNPDIRKPDIRMLELMIELERVGEAELSDRYN